MAWTDPITAAQANLITKLSRERGIEPKDTTGWNRKAASQEIDRLMALPKAQAAPAAAPAEPRMSFRAIPEVPAGRYALVDNDVTTFYKVDRPTKGNWAGRTFLAEEQGDNFAPIRIRGEQRERFFAVMEAIAADVEAAARRYGHHRRHCGFCMKKLTDSYSRFYGVGPVCTRRHGLPFSWTQFLKRNPEQADVVADWKAEDARRHENPEQDRLAYKAEFARQEAAQEAAAYRAKMARDAQLFADIRLEV